MRHGRTQRGAGEGRGPPLNLWEKYMFFIGRKIKNHKHKKKDYRNEKRKKKERKKEHEEKERIVIMFLREC